MYIYYMLSVILIFEDAIKERQDICCAHGANHLFVKSLLNNMLVLPHENKTMTTWHHFSSCYTGFLLDILCGSFCIPKESTGCLAQKRARIG